MLTTIIVGLVICAVIEGLYTWFKRRQDDYAAWVEADKQRFLEDQCCCVNHGDGINKTGLNYRKGGSKYDPNNDPRP